MLGLAPTLRRAPQQLCSRLVTFLGGRADRGDVPGWVLITLMTAGLVSVLWMVAGDRLETLFVEAIDGVTGPGAR